ncbi:MAG: thioredoxin [Pirellulaceae bacterium]|nr:MAG: thioredoxin [Pirellulaceae bacterium]
MMHATAIILFTMTAVPPAENLVLLEFTAEWCVPCRQMIPVVDRLMEAGYPVQRIDVDRYRRLADQWQVTSIPSYVLVRNGQEVDRLVGAASFDRIVRMFDKVGYQPPGTIVRGQTPRAGLAASIDTARDALQAAWTHASGRGATAGGGQASSAPSTEAYAEVSDDQAEAERRATAVTVRIQVQDPDGISFGSGTVIDVHGDEALVVTCGHLFRDSQGKSPIRVDLFLPQGEHAVEGRLLRFDAGERDMALLVIKPGVPLEPVSLGDPSTITAGQPVFSLGCDRGGPVRLVRSRINSVDRYVGQTRYLHTIQVAGDPVDGRSGGGLFDSAGRLIGVCYAADPSDVEEGLYMGVRTIQEFLDEAGLGFVYRKESAEPAERATTASVQESPQTTPSVAADAASRNETERLLELLEKPGEMMWLVRPERSLQGEVVLIDQATRELLAQQLRAALRR